MNHEVHETPVNERECVTKEIRRLALGESVRTFAASASGVLLMYQFPILRQQWVILVWALLFAVVSGGLAWSIPRVCIPRIDIEGPDIVTPVRFATQLGIHLAVVVWAVILFR